jgi:FixJ family two-component response regulator
VAATGKVIAVIDDDEFMLEALDQLLCTLGFKTELYGSAEAFVAAAMDSRAACLLSDIHLGDCTGLELARQLSAMGLTFPVIFMTGSDDCRIRKQAAELGCIAFLTKPFPHEQLQTALADAVG